MRRSQIVSTVKKSQARIDAPCALRNRRQDWRSRCGAGGTPAFMRMLRTEVAETLMPSLRSFADDPQIAPAWVLPGQTHDQITHLRGNRWAAWLAVRIRPMANDEATMPLQQRLWSHQEGAPATPRQHSAERRKK
jgi:hypothetical protein